MRDLGLYIAELEDAGIDFKELACWYLLLIAEKEKLQRDLLVLEKKNKEDRDLLNKMAEQYLKMVEKEMQ